jgi:hypothetical protein
VSSIGSVARAQIRTALCSYLSGAGAPEATAPHAWRGSAITNLGVVYDSPPKDFPRDWAIPANQPPGYQSGAMASVRFAQSLETRMSGVPAEVAPNGGYKRFAADVIVDVFFVSYQADGGDAYADYEALCDSLDARLRADPTLGGAVFAAGEGDVGSGLGVASRIAWDYGFPEVEEESGATTIYAGCKFGVVVHITG